MRKQPLERSADTDGLSDHVVGRHDDQQIDIAFVVRPAVGIGAEQDDLVRMKPLGNLPGKAADR